MLVCVAVSAGAYITVTSLKINSFLKFLLKYFPKRLI